MLLQANIEAPCTLLDFPSRERFIDELRRHRYDIVGISSILPNLSKVQEMCRLVRQHSPGTTIVVGGHVANRGGIDDLVDADHICRGDGVRWVRRFLGQDENVPIRHPVAYSAFGTRAMGITLPSKINKAAAILLPSVGCPVGCNFCSTSAMFGGKGRFINFYESGDELFSVMCELEEKLKVRSFFVMDENFLLHRGRAMRLLELLREHGKSWSLYVFSSGRVLQSYDIEQLVGLGISWVWLGLEGEASRYNKLRGIDTRELVRLLQSHGIRVLGSSIIGLEDHTPENIDRVIDYAVSHETDFHQFMLYTPVPGTPLYEKHRREGTLVPESERPEADIHGQYCFRHRHPYIPPGQETEFLLRAFRRDFEFNGPSLARIVRTTLLGWKRYKDHWDQRIRNRFRREARGLWNTDAAVVWAARRWFRGRQPVAGKMADILRDLYREFGWTPRLVAPLLGRLFHFTLQREEKRLAAGWTYEPQTICERNAAALALDQAVAGTGGFAARDS
jgi:radical SAM superfamily enzyme YgiQ (UPF0313 family)